MRQRNLHSPQESLPASMRAPPRRRETEGRDETPQPREMLFDMGVALAIALSFALLTQLALLAVHIS